MPRGSAPDDTEAVCNQSLIICTKCDFNLNTEASGLRSLTLTQCLWLMLIRTGTSTHHLGANEVRIFETMQNRDYFQCGDRRMGTKTSYKYINTSRRRNNWRHFAIFKCIFLNEILWISPKISLQFYLNVRINYSPTFADQATSH